MVKKSVIDWMSFLKGLSGFLLGFFAAQPVINHLINYVTSGMENLPDYVPSLLELVTGGLVGTILFLILLILGVKFFKTLAGFLIWLLIGILVGVIASSFGYHPIDWIVGLGVF